MSAKKTSAGKSKVTGRSYLRVDYGVRPAKHIERLMMTEAFHRLGTFAPIDEYGYVGFGAIYFRDFQLMRKRLGITRLDNIEYATDRARFVFNQPFRDMRMHFDSSSNVLPTLNWRRRAIVWLDYDAKISDSMLVDLDVVCTEAMSGSLLAITVDAEAEDEAGLPMKLEDLELDAEWKDPRVTSLEGDGLADLSYSAIRRQVDRVIAVRNSDEKDASKHLTFGQSFHFRYADGARMLTVGGIIHSAADATKFKASGIDTLSCYRPGPKFLRISVPRLTYRERRQLDQALPAKDVDRFAARWKKKLSIPLEDARNYARFYRYFPTFVDADL